MQRMHRIVSSLFTIAVHIADEHGIDPLNPFNP
jgi:hypothetical protein